MKLTTQKRLAMQVLNVGRNKVLFDKDRLDEIKEAITKADIRSLISNNAIRAKPKIGTSRVRARKRITQRRKGRQKGEGKRKGKRTARLSRKEAWMISIRNQRELLKKLKEKELISPQIYRSLYKKSKGGFFRSRRHIKLYLQEHNLVTKK